MKCLNHPTVDAVGRCAGCQESFCANCLVEIRGQKYCGGCKVAALQGQPTVEEATLPCKEADEALKYALIGIICFGIILEPIAVSKALKAKKKIETNPRLTGSGKANAALVIAIVVFILWIIGIIARVSSAGR